MTRNNFTQEDFLNTYATYTDFFGLNRGSLGYADAEDLACDVDYSGATELVPGQAGFDAACAKLNIDFTQEAPFAIYVSSHEFWGNIAFILLDDIKL